MNILESLFLFDQPSMHHAYIIEAWADEISNDLIEILEKKLSIDSSGNPDFTVLSYAVMGIGESHDAISLQSQTASSGTTKCIIIKTGKITHEAQNALLKIFEEPTNGTHFFLIVPTVLTILPTLLSRCLVIKLPNSSDDMLAKKFMSLSISERFIYIDEISQHVDDDVEKQERQKTIVDLVNSLELLISNTIKGEDREVAITSLLDVKKYMNDQSYSPRLLLGQLAVCLPVI